MVWSAHQIMSRSMNTSKLTISTYKGGGQWGRWPSTHGVRFGNSYWDEIASPPLDVKRRGFCIIHTGRELNMLPSGTMDQ